MNDDNCVIALDFSEGPKPMTTEGRILALLDEVGEAYGLEILTALKVTPWAYGTLRSMERRGILVSEERSAPDSVERGGRPRVYYRRASCGHTVPAKGCNYCLGCPVCEGPWPCPDGHVDPREPAG